MILKVLSGKFGVKKLRFWTSASSWVLPVLQHLDISRLQNCLFICPNHHHPMVSSPLCDFKPLSISIFFSLSCIKRSAESNLSPPPRNCSNWINDIPGKQDLTLIWNIWVHHHIDPWNYRKFSKWISFNKLSMGKSNHMFSDSKISVTT